MAATSSAAVAEGARKSGAGVPAQRRKKVHGKVPGQPPAAGGVAGARLAAGGTRRRGGWGGEEPGRAGPGLGGAGRGLQRALPGGAQLTLGRGRARCSPPALLSAQPAWQAGLSEG